VLVNDGIGLLD